MAGGCPGVLVLHAVGPAPIPFSQVLVGLVVGDRAFLLELVSNASSVGLVGQPRLDILDSSARVGVADGGVREGIVVDNLVKRDGSSSLPDWRPENSSVGRDAGEEGQREELQHDDA